MKKNRWRRNIYGTLKILIINKKVVGVQYYVISTPLQQAISIGEKGKTTD